MKYDYDSCARVASLFSTKRDFRKDRSKEHDWLSRNQLLDKACSHMARLHRVFSDADIAEIAKRYTQRRAFKLGDQSAYNAAKKRGLLNAVCSHMDSDRYRTMSNEQIAEIAGRFTTRVDFLNGDKPAYQTAHKRGILDVVCSHMEIREFRRLSDDEIMDIAAKYSTRTDFQYGDWGAYITAVRRGFIDNACAHMERGATGFREDRPAVLYQFRLELPCGLVLYKVGITNRKPTQRLITMGIISGVKASLMHAIKFDIGRDARIAEKRLHRRFSSYRYAGQPVMKNGNTELFTVPALEI